MASLKSHWGDKAFKERQITGFILNLPSYKKMEIHVFDTGKKTLWENYLKGSDRSFPLVHIAGYILSCCLILHKTV